MKKLLPFFLILPFLFAQFDSSAQLKQEGNSVKSNFKKEFLRSKAIQNNKTTACGTDTLYYSRYNATNFNYVNLIPSGTTPVLGAGIYFHVDDTVWLEGVNFYAYAMVTGTPVNCRVYYANATNKLPAGIPLITVSKNINTGFPIWLAPNLQRITFPNPIALVADFVVTIETTNNVTIVVAANDWVSGDGLNKNYSAIKVGTGWSNNINIGGVNFDADFYIEPVLSYNMTAQFEPGPNSCIGNSFPFEFVNTTTHALNPQFSFEAIDQTLDDNFLWDYGDGSPVDTTVHGLNTYSTVSSYQVNLDATFKTWTGTCQEDTNILIEESDLNANFQVTQEGLLVRFTDKSIDAKQWSWIFGDGSNGSVSKNPTHIYASFGTYPVKLTVRNEGCVSTTTLIMSLIDQTIGIDDVVDAKFNVEFAPNPASDFIEISVEGQLASDATWNLFNIHGKKVNSSILESKQRIELSPYHRGVYFLNFINGQQTMTKRLVLK